MPRTFDSLRKVLCNCFLVCSYPVLPGIFDDHGSFLLSEQKLLCPRRGNEIWSVCGPILFESESESDYLKGKAYKLSGYCGECHNFNAKPRRTAGAKASIPQTWAAGTGVRRVLKRALRALPGPLLVPPLAAEAAVRQRPGGSRPQAAQARGPAALPRSPPPALHRARRPGAKATVNLTARKLSQKTEEGKGHRNILYVVYRTVRNHPSRILALMASP